MKRVFAVILAVLMLTLCACGTVDAPAGTGSGVSTGNNNDVPGMPGNAQSNVSGDTQPGQTGTNTPVYTGPGYAAMLRVTINPEFALYLDAERNIIRTEAVNEDAKTLFAELDVTGQSYADGMAALLNAAYDQGFLKDGGQISIEFDITDSDTFDLAAIALPVTQFEEDKEVTVELSTGLYIEEVPEGQNSVVVDGQTLYIHCMPLLQDGTGEVVGEQINYFTVPVPEDVDAYNNETWNAMVKSVCRYYDGKVSTSYWEKGQFQYEIMIFPDGLIHYFTAGVDGYTTIYPPGYTETYQNDDGSTTVMTFYESGVMKTAETTWPNGDFQYDKYYENGNMKSVRMQYGGSYSEQSYGENGSLLRCVYNTSDGGQATDLYDSEGNRTSSHIAWSNGNYMEERFNKDGSLSFRIQSFDGYYVETTFHADGSSTDRYRNADGTSGTRKYDSRGNCIEDTPDQ